MRDYALPNQSNEPKAEYVYINKELHRQYKISAKHKCRTIGLNSYNNKSFTRICKMQKHRAKDHDKDHEIFKFAKKIVRVTIKKIAKVAQKKSTTLISLLTIICIIIMSYNFHYIPYKIYLAECDSSDEPSASQEDQFFMNPCEKQYDPLCCDGDDVFNIILPKSAQCGRKNDGEVKNIINLNKI
eukprot:369842_1